MESGKGFLDTIAAGEGGYKTARVGGSSLIDLIGLITFFIISLLGVFFVIKLIYAGFLWMTASGSEEQVGKSKSIIFSSIIGLAIVLSAFVTSQYIFTKIGMKAKYTDALTGEYYFKKFSEGAGYEATTTGTTPAIVIANLIKWLLTILAIIFSALTIYSGYLWLTAGGNEEQVGLAKKRIINAVLGLVLCLTAYAITYMILEGLIEAVL